MKQSFLIIASLLLLSCNENEDIVNEVPPTGSIETSISVDHLNKQFDVLTTKHVVHPSTGASRVYISYDTIPALDETLQEGEDENGDLKTDWAKKNYEIYITVK